MYNILLYPWPYLVLSPLFKDMITYVFMICTDHNEEVKLSRKCINKKVLLLMFDLFNCIRA